MTKSSRTKNSLKNSIVALIYYILYLVLSFFSRKVFLEYLGTDILGLNTTAQNLLQFLNLAELGIGVAVGFTLYKPIFDNDENTINEIVTLQGYLYKRIAYFLILGSAILMCFFPLIFKKITLPLWYTYAIFGVLLFSALLSYFVNYRQIVLTASQKDYKIQYSLRSVTIIKIVVQMIAVTYFPNGFIWWLALEAIFAGIGSAALHRITMKEFPGLISVDKSFKELRTKYSYFVTKIKQIFFHKLGGFVLTQTSPLIIYAYSTLSLVAIYGNYTILVSGLLMLVNAIFNSIGAGVGNLVAEGDQNKINKVFCELFSIRFLIVSTLCFCLYMLADPFITLWIGKEYLLPDSTLLLIVCMLFINLSRLTVDAFINAYGLFSDIWAPIVESILNIGLSVLLGAYFGLNGILSGVIISQIIIIVLWKPYFLISRKMRGFGMVYLKIYLSHLFIFLIISWITLNIFNRFEIQEGLVNFITYSLMVCGVFFTFMLLSLMSISKGMREGLSRILLFVSRKRI